LPVLASLSPDRVLVGASGVTLSNIDGAARTTTFVDAATLSVTLTSADTATAATHQLGLAEREKSPAKERGYNTEYLQLLAHYGLEARTIHIASPNENGDVESSNGSLKRAVERERNSFGCVRSGRGSDFESGRTTALGKY